MSGPHTSEAPCEAPSEALIVGGGLAGASLAIHLAAAGREVVLVEKSAGAHPKVCGEFLSHEALHYLRALGLEPQALGAVSIEHVRLARQEIVATARLPFAALSLSRECLDEALLARAAAAGASVLRGRRVQRLSAPRPRSSLWQAELAGDQALAAPQVFLATGKHDLYGWARPPGRQNDLLAFKMYYRLAPGQQEQLAGHVELIVFPGGYAGLQPVEGGRANLCLLVSRAAFRRAGGDWLSLLEQLQREARHLETRLAGSSAVWARPLSLSAIPYGLIRENAEDGLWRLGDQSAVIPSFAGDGMSIALHSARLAAEVYSAGGGTAQYQRRLAREVGARVRAATVLARMLVGVPGPLLAAARLFPAMLPVLARSTRIPARYLLPGMETRGATEEPGARASILSPGPGSAGRRPTTPATPTTPLIP